MTESECHDSRESSGGKGMTSIGSLSEQVGDELAEAMGLAAGMMRSMNGTVTQLCAGNDEKNCSM
jgi:hypothetical protein